MPEKKIIRPFKEKESYDKNEHIVKEVESVKAYLTEELNYAFSIPNRAFRVMCMFSVIDCLAQEFFDYPTLRTSDAFYQFVTKFQDRYDYLKAVEPVTLYYDYEPNIKFKEIKQSLKDRFPDLFRPQREISLEEKLFNYGMSFEGMIASGKAEEILAIIERDNEKKIVEKYKKNHELLSLIYKMRSKVVHELSSIGAECEWDDEEELDEPYYISMERLYESEGNIVSDNVIELKIPSRFVFNLANNILDNYMGYCLKTKRPPFKNRKNFRRSVDITWRD